MDKYNIKTYNSISPWARENKHVDYQLTLRKKQMQSLLRSHKLSIEEIEESVYGIFRAGRY